MYLYFTRDTVFTGLSLPAGWGGVVRDGDTWTTDFAETFSTENPFDIPAWDSLNGFSFMIDYQAGNVSYDAFFSGDNIVSGVTAPAAPEPEGYLYFVNGGIILAGIGYRREKRSTSR